MKLVCLVVVLLLLSPRWGMGSAAGGGQGRRNPLLSCEDRGLGEWVKEKGLGKCQKVDTPSKLNANSLAPWVYLECVDPDRFPRRLVVTECEEEHCRPPVAVLPAVPVMYHVWVRYRKLPDGAPGHCAATLQIPVACTCLLEKKRIV